MNQRTARRLANIEKLKLSPEDEYLRHEFPWVINRHGYFVRYWQDETGKTKAESLHRMVLGLPKMEKSTYGHVVDHVNGDRLDNRRDNLRIVPQQKNAQNRHVFHKNKSGFRGVRSNGKGWMAFAKINYKFHALGTYDTPEKAAKVAEEFREKHYVGLRD